MADPSHRVAAAVTGTPSANDAFAEHVLPEIEVLLRVARSITRDPVEAEDLVQDTLLKAYRAIERFDGRHPRAWLLTILRNTNINRHRKRRPELMRDPDAELERLAAELGDDAPDGSVDAGFDHEIEVALAQLPEVFRQVIELVDVDGLSYAEAAEALGVPIGTVMSRLHRARARIRTQLADAGVAPRST